MGLTAIYTQLGGLILSSIFRISECTTTIGFKVEDSPRGLWRSLGKRVGSDPSRVQIPYPPPNLRFANVIRTMKKLK